MFRLDSKNVRSGGLAVALAIAGAAAFTPVTPAHAQSAPQPRSLPDFTDLVDQVGPAVVNIRTVERARSLASAGSGGSGGSSQDEEMQEFFRRFFGVPIPVWYPLDSDGNPDYDSPIVPSDGQLPVDPAADAAPGFDESQRDVPGGFIESSGFSELVRACFPELDTAGDVRRAYVDAVRNKQYPGSEHSF